MNLANVVELCEALDAEMARREQSRDVSLLVAGAAFEQWLSFESRLLLEKRRNSLGVQPSWWTANEFKKVDLGVWSGWTTLHVALEFKLVHNNQNWKAKIDSAWGDLFPAARSAKEALNPGLRVAIVGIVGKVYTDPKVYPGQRADLAGWQREVWEYALPSTGRYSGQVQRAWQGRRFRIEDPSLDQGRADHFFELHLLVPSSSVPTP